MTPTAADAPAGRFDPPYDRLRALPRSVWRGALVSAVGTRTSRLDDAARWLAALPRGELPDEAADFGDREAITPLRRICGELGLPALARGLPAIAEQILRSLLWHLDRLIDLQPSLSRAQAIASVSADFAQEWRRETQGVEEDLVLLRQLADGAEWRWDELRGRLTSRDWQVARRAAERLAALPELVALLERLGRRDARPLALQRAQAQPEDGGVEVPLVAVETRIAGAPGELTGIRFGASVERMLACEATLRCHATGQRLWRARHAEGRLLEHDSEAVLIDWRPDPGAPARPHRARTAPQPLARGPLVLCLDTSASMQGAPENLAKAVALATLRIARAEHRGCKLIAFGAPGELIERDLDAGAGLDALLELMGQSFDGGTDVQTPIERALDAVQEAAWIGADLVLVTDGEFGCVPATRERLDRARHELGLFVQGVLVGDRETLGLLDVCDAIHWVRDWRRHADGSAANAERHGYSPVHSKSLTALYFPNALSPQARRHQAGQRSGER
jgi:uncharacterized protein with von Willebrand factor type A (vWA) domain